MTTWALLASLIAVLLAFWIRAAGTAITRIPRADALKDSSDGVDGAARVAGLLDEREVVSPAVGVVASALLIVSAVLATAVLVADRSAGEALLWALGVSVAVFLIGDLVPRAVGRIQPRTVAYRSAALLRLAVSLGGWANDLLPEVEEDGDGSDLQPPQSEEHERELIDSVLEFTETIVREVMTPRPDMVTVEVTSSLEQLIEVASEAGFSRVPVMADEDVVGLVIVKDLLPLLTEGNHPGSVAEVMRPVEFVPETKHVASLLAEMQESRTHQVIVVDEYGDVAGLVTIEDLLEELVGEIADETDLEERLVVSTDEGWEVDARLPVDELVEVTGVDIPDEDWDTVGGLVLGLAERIPEEGEQFEFRGLLFTVNLMQGRRVSQVGVQLVDRAEAV